MTRVNLIPVNELFSRHAMAEYREIPMVLASLRRTITSKRGFLKENVPAEFTLNAGHVTFFYDKLKWLYNRYEQLVAELSLRGFQIDPESRGIDWGCWVGTEYWNDWVPTEKEIAVSRSRIDLRVSQKPWLYTK